MLLLLIYIKRRKRRMKDEFEREVSYCIFCKATTPHINGECIACEKKDIEIKIYSQVWSCKKCKATKAIKYRENESPNRVATKIVESHRETSPFCLGSIKHIMIHPPIDTIN